MKLQKVVDSTLLRDPHSKALLEGDFKKAEEYKLKRKMMVGLQGSDQKINNLESRVDELDNKLNIIIELLKEKN